MLLAARRRFAPCRRCRQRADRRCRRARCWRASTRPTGNRSPQLKQAVQLTPSPPATSTSSSIYGRAGTEIPQRLDIVIPLLKTGLPGPRRASCCASTRGARCFPTLSNWPVPSPQRPRPCCGTAWTVRSLNISEVRHQADSLGPHQRAGRHVDDPRGARRFAASCRAASPPEVDRLLGPRRCCGWPGRCTGTDWWMVAKIDMAEVDAHRPGCARARPRSPRLLALLGAALAGRACWSQRRVVQPGRGASACSSANACARWRCWRRSRSSATDAIYAKDLRGPLRVLQPRRRRVRRPRRWTTCWAAPTRTCSARRWARGACPRTTARAALGQLPGSLRGGDPHAARPGARAVHQGAAGRRGGQRCWASSACRAT